MGMVQEVAMGKRDSSPFPLLSAMGMFHHRVQGLTNLAKGPLLVLAGAWRFFWRFCSSWCYAGWLIVEEAVSATKNLLWSWWLKMAPVEQLGGHSWAGWQLLMHVGIPLVCYSFSFWLDGLVFSYGFAATGG
ncbi:hypothetical protein GOP47_0008826 [Adiantum capillus-veneris]|uniref:Uncharacterized protein n=1 Tax=Adiantum capillus-veneris TaxID=13818 RepID=A0A9D4UZL7_ADICA|nr:hypothetical protein GOP47_0008826 [Adiantum capillus-veneris]